MLPNRRIGKPKEEFWSGLLDGIYAIAITLLVLDIPDILTKTSELFQGQNIYKYKLATLIVITNELFNYIFIFLILYEFWCFHRASIKLTRLEKRWQNFFNSLLLANICLLPATKSFIISKELQIIGNKAIELNNTNIWKFFFEFFNTTPAINLVYFQCALFFIILTILLSKTKDNISLEIKQIKIESKKRILIFTLLFSFNYFIDYPHDFINLCYLLYSNYERQTFENE